MSFFGVAKCDSLLISLSHSRCLTVRVGLIKVEGSVLDGKLRENVLKMFIVEGTG